MTDFSSLLLGWLCLASAIMVFGSRKVMHRQRRSGERWISSMPLQLSTALYIHGLSAIPAFLATLIAGTKPVSDPSTYLLWATWSGWLIAKSMVIRVTGHLQFALALYSLWAVVWIAWRGIIGG